MGDLDRRQFQDAAVQASRAQKSQVIDPAAWNPAMAQFFRMAMFDILPALRDLPADVRLNFHHAARFLPIGDASRQRYEFARAVVIEHEIKDLGLPDDQVNDGRVFLGCTPLDDKGVRAEIMRAETEARAMISSGATDSLGSCDAARQPTDEAKCCGVTRVAWEVVLVSDASFQVRRESRTSLLPRTTCWPSGTCAQPRHPGVR